MTTIATHVYPHLNLAVFVSANHGCLTFAGHVVDTLKLYVETLFFNNVVILWGGFSTKTIWLWLGDYVLEAQSQRKAAMSL